MERWYVEYFILNENTDKYKRFRVYSDLIKYSTYDERYKRAKEIKQQINEQLLDDKYNREGVYKKPDKTLEKKLKRGLKEKIKKLQDKLKEQEERIKKQEATINNLKRELDRSKIALLKQIKK